MREAAERVRALDLMAEHAYRGIPGAKAIGADNAGHMIPLEQPDRLAARIAEFHRVRIRPR